MPHEIRWVGPHQALVVAMPVRLSSWVLDLGQDGRSPCSKPDVSTETLILQELVIVFYWINMQIAMFPGMFFCPILKRSLPSFLWFLMCSVPWVGQLGLGRWPALLRDWEGKGISWSVDLLKAWKHAFPTEGKVRILADVILSWIFFSEL